MFKDNALQKFWLFKAIVDSIHPEGKSTSGEKFNKMPSTAGQLEINACQTLRRMKNTATKLQAHKYFWPGKPQGPRRSFISFILERNGTTEFHFDRKLRKQIEYNWLGFVVPSDWVTHSLN